MVDFNTLEDAYRVALEAKDEEALCLVFDRMVENLAYEMDVPEKEEDPDYESGIAQCLHELGLPTPSEAINAWRYEEIRELELKYDRLLQEEEDKRE